MIEGLGGLIVDRRRQLGISQLELARRLGVPAPNLSDIEHSFHRWQSRLLWALADALYLPQVEVAIAAGIITDLPALSGEAISDPLDDPGFFADLFRSTATLADRSELELLLHELSPSEEAFVTALIRQLVARHRLPSVTDLAAET